MSTVTRKIKKLYELPPKSVVAQLRTRAKRAFGNKQAGRQYDIDEVIASPKHMRQQRLYDFLSRYERILDRNTDWVSLSFEGKNVLELGCGPLMGWAPLAIFSGCERYTCIEPQFNYRIFRSDEIKNRYLLPLHKDLSAVYGRNMTFQEFTEEISERVEILASEVLEAELQGPYNVLLSNSCLEHIHGLKESLRKLRAVSSEDCRFLHLVDFGNHRSTASPFKDMYSMEPEAYFQKFGRHINLLRLPDVARCLRESQFDHVTVPYYSFDEFYDDEICDYWKRYDMEELFIKTVIFAK